MSKQIEPTKAILDQIAKVTGAEVDPSKIAIFEAIALNTSPLTKRGSIYDKARAQPSLLNAMADFVNSGGAVPLHTLHQQGSGVFTSGELPVGRVFQAQVIGDKELRCLFFVGNDTPQGADLISKLDNGTIDEVSVGVMAARALCSKCNDDFDYFDPANRNNLWDRTCANEHTLGENGTHLKLDGLDNFMELSLVSRGAAKNAKIVGRAKARMGSEAYASKLAASGQDPEMLTLFAEAGHVCAHNHGGEHPTPRKKEAEMADESLAASALSQIAQLASDKTKAETELAAANTRLAELTTKFDEVTKQVAELTSKVEAAADALKLKDEHTALVAFIKDATQKALVASGEKEPKVPETVPAMLEALEGAKVKLQNLPTGGVADAAADNSVKETASYLPASAFTARK